MQAGGNAVELLQMTLEAAEKKGCSEHEKRVGHNSAGYGCRAATAELPDAKMASGISATSSAAYFRIRLAMTALTCANLPLRSTLPWMFARRLRLCAITLDSV